MSEGENNELGGGVRISIREPEDRQGSCIGLVAAKKRPREIHGAISIVAHPAYVPVEIVK